MDIGATHKPARALGCAALAAKFVPGKVVSAMTEEKLGDGFEICPREEQTIFVNGELDIQAQHNRLQIRRWKANVISSNA